MLCLLQGCTVYLAQGGPRASPPHLAYKKVAVSAVGNWEAHEATQCGLQVHRVPNQVPLGGIPAAVFTILMTFTSLSPSFLICKMDLLIPNLLLERVSVVG